MTYCFIGAVSPQFLNEHDVWLHVCLAAAGGGTEKVKTGVINRSVIHILLTYTVSPRR